jgi:hypothetical protein
MIAKKIKAEKIERGKYSAYLKKAQDFFDAMHQSSLSSNWNAAGLAAVHCAISSNDALLVYFRGVRSSSDNHLDAIELLQGCQEIDGVENMVSHLRRIIGKKNLIEYEARQFFQSEAEEIIKHTERFYNRVRALLL